MAAEQVSEQKATDAFGCPAPRVRFGRPVPDSRCGRKVKGQTAFCQHHQTPADRGEAPDDEERLRKLRVEKGPKVKKENHDDEEATLDSRRKKQKAKDQAILNARLRELSSALPPGLDYAEEHYKHMVLKTLQDIQADVHDIKMMCKRAKHRTVHLNEDVQDLQRVVLAMQGNHQEAHPRHEVGAAQGSGNAVLPATRRRVPFVGLGHTNQF
jgi:hypothetical protein